MDTMQMDNAGNSRLRFVFDDAVVSLSLAANATFEDIAKMLGELAPLHRGNPVAIAVTLGSGKGESARHMLCRPGQPAAAAPSAAIVALPRARGAAANGNIPGTAE